MNRKKLRSVVQIEAVDNFGSVVQSIELPYDEYYSDSHPLIDDDAFRARNNVRRISGKVFNSQGAIQSEFTNEYDDRGTYISGRTVHEDGTVTE